LTAHSCGTVTLTADELQKYRENLLLFSLEAKDTQYSTAMFFELGGNPMRSDYPKVDLSAESMVAISREMAKLNIHLQ
jgi:hypothetical protein